jgi:membrane protease YdiL (CAAX protease family)
MLLKSRNFARYLFPKLGKMYFVFLCFYLCIYITEKTLSIKLFVESVKDERTFTELFIGALIIAPILEEYIFRFWLNFRKKSLFISFTFFIIGYMYWYGFQTNNIEIPIYLFLLFLYLYTFSKQSIIGTEIVIILTSIIFGLVHATNLTGYQNLPFYILFVNTVRQMIFGYFLAKVRLEKGISYSVSLHFLINLIAVLLSILLKT